MSTNNTPLISIAMAVYNGENYLKEQIDSILLQTISDFELIICDDCSSDGTWDLLKQLSQYDDRIKVYRNIQNLGFKKNFEKAINLCTGDYIALSDQDDVWEKKHLELLLEAIGEKFLACGNSLLVNQYGEPLGITLKEQEALDFIPDDDFAKLKSILLFRNPYQGATMLFKRDLLKYILPFPNTVDYHDTWIASVACVTGGLVYVDEVLLKYRRIANSVTGWRTKRKSKIKSFAHAWLFEDRIGIIDELLLRVDSISNIQIKKLQFYKSLIINNTKIRKPFTIMYLLFDYKSIYSCDNLHWF